MLATYSMSKLSRVELVQAFAEGIFSGEEFDRMIGDTPC